MRAIDLLSKLMPSSDQRTRLFPSELRRAQEGIREKWAEKKPAVKPSVFDLYMAMLEGEFLPLEANLDRDTFEAHSDKRGIYVDWGDAVVATQDHLLATNGMGPCAALRVNNDLQYMLHAYPRGTGIEEMRISLQQADEMGLGLSSAEINLMPGSVLDSLTAIRILEAIRRIDKSLLDNVKLVRDFKGYFGCQGIASVKDSAYRYSERWGIRNDFYLSTTYPKKLSQTFQEHGFQQLIC